MSSVSPSRLPSRVPSYRHHKGSGQAFVQVNGRRHYIGKYGTPASEEKYRRVIAELMVRPSAPRDVPAHPGQGLLVVQLCAAFWEFAERYYVKDGKPTDHLHTVRRALSLLREFYGDTPATEFGPLSVRAIQGHLVDAGRARSYLNSVCAAIKRTFKWAASRELIPVTIHQALATVPGLKRGRSEAREPAPVLPVADEVVEATIPWLPPVVVDMVRFQRLTGCRPGEVCKLRPGDVDRSGEVWAYRPSRSQDGPPRTRASDLDRSPSPRGDPALLAPGTGSLLLLPG
jgi:hypothetical protein